MIWTYLGAFRLFLFNTVSLALSDDTYTVFGHAQSDGGLPFSLGCVVTSPTPKISCSSSHFP